MQHGKNSGMTRICHIVSSLRTGGMERMVCDLLAAMRQAETLDVELPTLDRKAEKPFGSSLFCTDAEGELYEGAPVGIKACGHRKQGWFIIDWRLVRQMVRFVREQHVHLLHAHNHAPSLYGTIVSLLTGIPVIVTRHGRGYDTLRWKFLTRLLSLRAKKVVFVSEDARRLAIANGTVSARKAVVIHNGVDTRRFRSGESGYRIQDAGFRKKLGIPSDAVVIGSVGRLSPEKNVPLLVRAFARLLRGETTDYRLQTTDPASSRKRDYAEASRIRDTGCRMQDETSGRRAEGRGQRAKGETSDIRLQTLDQEREITEPQRVPLLGGVRGGLGLPLGETGPTPDPQSVVCGLPSIAYAAAGGLMSEVYLILIGDGPDRGRIEAEMARCGVGDRCFIAGMQSDVLPWLQAMDIFCLSSDTEGLSISLLEAEACGLPAVVTDVGGNREIVQEGVTGCLVARRDEQALGRALGQMAMDAGLRIRMGRAARARILEQFSRGGMVRQYRRIYGAHAEAGR
jgi:glycosyltransferase involved in cell wall biosynthesis